MSIKRKIAVPALMSLFCALCIFTALTVVKAEETTKDITGSGYTVTIPAEVNVGSDGTGEMEVKGTVLPYHKLNVEVASTNNYKLICGSQKIAYTISEDAKSFSHTTADESAERTFSEKIAINAPTASSMNISGEYTDTLTFTMTCTPTQYFTLTLDPNGGTFSDGTTTARTKKNLAYGATYGELPTELTRSNCTFAGWYNVRLNYDNNEEAQVVTSETTITGDTTIYAHWSGTWNVKIESNGGTLWVKDKNIISGASENSPVRCDSATIKVQYFDGAYNNLLINAVKEGYTCTGYFDATAGGHKVWESAGGAYVGSDSIYYKNLGGSRGSVWVNNGIEAGETFTFYPQWQANTYTIQYDANVPDGESVSGTMSAISCTYDTDATLTANGFTREDYTFAGWNTKADGTGTPYANGATVKNLTAEDKGTITLYAQWIKSTNSNDTAEDETPDAPADTATETANVPEDAALPEAVNEETEEPQA